MMVLPFLLFFVVVAAFGLVFVAAATLVASRGHERGAASMLIAVGVLFIVGGVLLFAPQPVWAGSGLIGLGIARLVRTTRDAPRRSA